jgi:hypothetical protein
MIAKMKTTTKNPMSMIMMKMRISWKKYKKRNWKNKLSKNYKSSFLEVKKYEI